jgi:hypothetical protein
VLLGVVPAAEHVFEAPLGGDGLRGREPRAGVRDQADPGEDLIRLDDDVVAAVDALDPWRPIAERRIDAGLPQIGRFEDVRVGREHQGQHRHLLSHLIARSSFGNRPIAVKPAPAQAGGERDKHPCPAAFKAGLGCTWAEPRCHTNGRNRRIMIAGRREALTALAVSLSHLERDVDGEAILDVVADDLRRPRAALGSRRCPANRRDPQILSS